MEVDQQILDLAISPISDDAPCGINAKYEPAYESLETEIAKSESLDSESTDWACVRDFSTDILKNTSKDYSTACYLAFSLTQLDGYEGLMLGSTLLESLSEKYWDDMYPPKKRLRGRQNSTQWFIEKVSAFIDNREPSDKDMALIPSIHTSIKNLDYFLSEKMADSAPNFSDLLRPLKRLKAISAQKETVVPPTTKVNNTPTPEAHITPAAIPEAVAPVQTKQPVTQEETPAPEVKLATPSPATEKAPSIEPIGNVASDAEARKALKQTQDSLRKLANYFGKVKASDPRRFRLSRSALWDNLDKLPPVKENKTQLPSPPSDKLKKLIELFESGEFLEAVNFGEKVAEKLPYWFDGNRYIALSLEALGSDFTKAKECLENELKSFIGRLPKILDLEYANGDAFANDQSKAWIKSLATDSQASDNSSHENVDAISTAFSEAKKLAMSGKLSDGFTLLNNCIANTKRDQFKIKMACAELACLNGKTKVGIPMLERLIEETRTLKVADWESDFLAKALALLVNAYEELNEADSNSKQLEKDAAYDQLCWYNPALLTSNS